MVKTIFNKLGNDVKGLIKYACENQSNNTNDKIRIKKIMSKIVNNLDVNVCKNHLLKSIYV